MEIYFETEGVGCTTPLQSDFTRVMKNAKDTIKTSRRTDASLCSLPHVLLAQRPYPLVPSARLDARCAVSSLRRCAHPLTSLPLVAGPHSAAPRLSPAASSAPHFPPGSVYLTCHHCAASSPWPARSPGLPPSS
jgi:hypothetical protein